MTTNDPGYLNAITEEEAGRLSPDDPNLAAAGHGDDGPVNHEDYLGAFVDDDEQLAVDDAEPAAREPDHDGDGIPDAQDPDAPDGGAR